MTIYSFISLSLPLSPHFINAPSLHSVGSDALQLQLGKSGVPMFLEKVLHSMRKGETAQFTFQVGIVCVCVCVCVCVSVCVRYFLSASLSLEKELTKFIFGLKISERERERERESVCVCVCVIACVAHSSRHWRTLHSMRKCLTFQV